MKTLPSSVSALLLLSLLSAAPAEPSKAATAMQSLVDAGDLAGAVTLVERNGKTFLEAVGKRDLAKAEPMQTDDLFWIASMTKPMTAACVMMLADEGKLSIDDPVKKHLPEFHDQWLIAENGRDRRVLVKPERPITIRDLLTHTSGLANVPGPRPDSTLAEIAMGAAHEPLRFPPGSRWEYCNTGINTLGRIVAVLGGEPFAEFLQARLLDPLGMKDTTFWPSPEQAARIATSYTRKDGGKLEATDVYFLKGGLSDRRRTAFPAGGLYSTAEDVAKFYRMMLAGGTAGDRTLLKNETVAEMTRMQTGDIKTGFTDGMSWGLGFQVVKEPQGITAPLSPGTFGHGGAHATQSWADPKRGAIYIMMIQRAGLPNGDGSDIRKAFQTAAAATAGE